MTGKVEFSLGTIQILRNQERWVGGWVGGVGQMIMKNRRFIGNPWVGHIRLKSVLCNI